MDGGDGGTTVWMDLMSLMCIPKKGQNSQFYAMDIYHS